MTQRNQIYKCEICGNMVEVLASGRGELVCCGEPMSLLDTQNQDTGLEKHVPVVKKIGEGIKVTVGEVPHPMEDSHFIQWIEVIADDKVYRTYLQPGSPAEVVVPVHAKDFEVREYCNLHGLWKA